MSQKKTASFSTHRFQNYARFLVAYTLLVILWGAWVRISHSGDGCGDHWPLCQGALIPEFQQKKTWIEYAHRAMSGVFGIFILCLFLWGRRISQQFRSEKLFRFFLTASAIFTVTEALLGAQLVLKGLVGMDRSFDRSFFMGLHMVNSLCLSGSIAMVDYLSRSKHRHSFQWKKQSLFAAFLLFLLMISSFGSVASLSTTLFPHSDLMESFRQEFSSSKHWILAWRSLHPVFAILGGLIFLSLFRWKFSEPDSGKMKELRLLAIVLTAALSIGVLTLLLQSPLVLKLLHLSLAHGIWMLSLRFLFPANDPHLS